MPSRKLLALVLACVLVFYPPLVFLGLQHYGPRLIAVVVLAVALLRVVLSGQMGPASANTRLLLLAALIATGITLLTGSIIGLKFYPVLVSVTLLVVFGLSLWKPPTVVERLARLQDAELPPEGVRYTRKVTWVWCVFFVVNAAIATATVYASDQVWALYNGLISYLLMGVLFSLEYLCRRRVQQRSGVLRHE